MNPQKAFEMLELAYALSIYSASVVTIAILAGWSWFIWSVGKKKGKQPF